MALTPDLQKAVDRGVMSLEDAWRTQANRLICSGDEEGALKAITEADKAERIREYDGPMGIFTDMDEENALLRSAP